MNKEMKPADLLRNAAVLVNRAVNQLNKNWKPYGGCGAKRFDDFVQGRVYERLATTEERLRETADELDNNGNKL